MPEPAIEYPEEIKAKHTQRVLNSFKLTCPNCGSERSRVADTRGCRDRNAIKRIRECLGCGHLFKTFEFLESQLNN